MFKNSTQFSLERNLEFGKTMRIKTIFFFDLSIFIIGFFWGLKSFDSDKELAIMFWIVFAIAGLVLPFILNYALKNSTKKVMTKNPLQEQSIINNFIFSENEMISQATKEEKEISHLTIAYKDIIKIIENKENLYIFVGQLQAFLLNADGMTEGSFDELKEFLKSKYINGKYFIRKGIFHVRAN